MPTDYEPKFKVFDVLEDKERPSFRIMIMQYKGMRNGVRHYTVKGIGYNDEILVSEHYLELNYRKIPVIA